MNYTYKEMLENAKKSGVTNEKKMWDAIGSISDLLLTMDSETYWKFMREQHGILYGNHYDEVFALHDVKMLKYVNREGKECTGPHWTMEQVEEATRTLRAPEGTTKWDAYVALNAFYSDMCQDMTDEQIIKGAWRFYFCDADAPKGKIWIYMAAMR